MSRHNDRVRDFFDRAAGRYRSKPGSATDCYFSQRLQLAIDLTAPSPRDRVLDLGCGTGLLYQRLCYFEAQKNYLGIDLSPGMLAKSSIPENKRQEISFTDYHAATEKSACFDLIFALGLTTYLSPSEFRVFHEILAERLAPGGQAVVSYTHSASYDFRLRNWLNRRLGSYFPADSSLGRDFPILATRPEQVSENLPEQLFIQKVEWLSPAFPGLQFLPPRFQSFLTNRDAHNRWRGDFLLLLSRR